MTRCDVTGVQHLIVCERAHSRRMPPDVRTPRILFVASGPAAVALRGASVIERRFVDHRVDLVVAESLLGELTPDQRSRVVFVVGRSSDRFRFLWTARLESYWMISIVLAGQPGYFTMKLAALLLGLGRVIVCFNENG